jgi:hypothetical protein
MPTITDIIRTDDSSCFVIAATSKGAERQTLWGPGPHTLETEAWSQPGGPRGTSGAQLLPAGTVISRISVGDPYTCARWQAVSEVADDSDEATFARWSGQIA